MSHPTQVRILNFYEMKQNKMEFGWHRISGWKAGVYRKKSNKIRKFTFVGATQQSTLIVHFCFEQSTLFIRSSTDMTCGKLDSSGKVTWP
jgi:hypothetical protein